MREDLPDDGGIVQGGDQAQPASIMGTGRDVNGKRPVHQRCISAAQLQARGGLFSPNKASASGYNPARPGLAAPLPVAGPSKFLLHKVIHPAGQRFRLRHHR